MSQPVSRPPESLYELDETAWLEQTASLVAQRRFDEIDPNHLSAYLSDMAGRDKREAFSRLVTLLAHLLKWEHQLDQQSKSWRVTILEQRRELEQLLESGTLRRHASDVLAKAYAKAVLEAAAETGLAEDVFPAQCPWGLGEVLASPSDAE